MTDSNKPTADLMEHDGTPDEPFELGRVQGYSEGWHAGIDFAVKYKLTDDPREMGR